MATKDKLVTLEDLNELKKYNDSEVSDLKSDLNNSTEAISALIFSPIDEQTRTNTNYCACSLTAGKTYKIGISVATAGTYTVHSSTAPSASTVVDLLMSNVALEANVPRYIYYKPSVDIAYIRLSSNTVVWTVSLLEGVSTVDVAENIATLQDDVTALGAESEKIGDILFDKLEKAGDNTQIFNTDNYIKVDNVYCQASGNLISYAGCTIFTTEVNASAGENFVWQFFNDAAYGSTVIGLQCFTSNVIPSVGAVTIDVGGTIDTQNKRGQLLLTSAAKYISVMVRFADANTKATYETEFADTLLLKIGTAYSAEYMPYYLTVAQSVERGATGNYWAGKKIWWCGTSIPEGRDTALDSEGSGLSYPELVGQILGATVYNESLGSSMCRANVRTGDYVDAMAVNLVRAFTQTTEEKQNLIDNWQTIRQSLRDPNYYTSLESIADTVRGASFEARLMPYLNGTKPMPDLFVFDHGHNDWKTFYTMPDGTTPDTELKPTVENITNNVLAEDTYMTANSNAKLISFYTEISAIPSDKRDEFIASVNRNCFIGAVNFLCTLILSKNPRARIIFIGNIDNWEKPQVQPAQEYLSESWDFHLIKMWEYLGFSGHYIPNTATYWTEEGTTDLTVKRIYCKDGVHPHSDSTGEAIELYAHIIANELRDIR